MSDGIACLHCGYLESSHEEDAKQYYDRVRPNYEVSADTCPGFENE